MKKIAWIWMVSICMFACGTRPHQSKAAIDKAQENLLLAQQTNCTHDSLPLAEKYLQEAEKYNQLGEYQKAKAKAQLGNQYALEVIEYNKEYPCKQNESDVEDDGTQDPLDPSKQSDQSNDQSTTDPDGRLATIYFKYDSAQLSASAIQTLEQHIKKLRLHPTWKVRLTGHCDSRGSVGYNLVLSERRAQMVERYFEEAGIEEQRLTSVGYGSEMLASERMDREGHQLNRRVEFEVMTDSSDDE